MEGFTVIKNLKKKEEERIIAKYKLKESIRAKFRKLGAEDLAEDLFEYINELTNNEEGKL